MDGQITDPREDGTLRVGRTLFAACMCAFGVQYLIYGRLRSGLPPLPGWFTSGHTLAYVMAAALLTMGVLVLLRMKVGSSSIALSLVLFFGAAVQMLRFRDVVTKGNDRTQALEALALAAAACVLAGAEGHTVRDSKLAIFGRWLFIFTLLIFGLQHFLYLQYLATLVPSWLPFHVFWIVFTGVAFIAAAIGIAVGYGRTTAALLLSLMFFSWVCILHLPRIAKSPHNGDEWSSGLVALAFCGASLLFARPVPGGTSKLDTEPRLAPGE